jgi:uncharacterized membrane protein YfcA
LILFATVLLAAKSGLARLGKKQPTKNGRSHAVALFVGQLAVSIYGGYFGAGMGILMLAVLGLYGVSDFHERNALKNLLAATTNGLAGIYFIAAGSIRWDDGLALGMGAVTGGLVGAVVGRRLSSKVLEGAAIVVGIIATASLILGR